MFWLYQSVQIKLSSLVDEMDEMLEKTDLDQNNPNNSVRIEWNRLR